MKRNIFQPQTAIFAGVQSWKETLHEFFQMLFSCQLNIIHI